MLVSVSNADGTFSLGGDSPQTADITLAQELAKMASNLLASDRLFEAGRGGWVCRCGCAAAEAQYDLYPG